MAKCLIYNAISVGSCVWLAALSGDREALEGGDSCLVSGSRSRWIVSTATTTTATSGDAGDSCPRRRPSFRLPSLPVVIPLLLGVGVVVAVVAGGKADLPAFGVALLDRQALAEKAAGANFGQVAVDREKVIFDVVAAAGLDARWPSAK